MSLTSLVQANYYIAFIILSASMGDEFGGAVNILNIVLHYVYLGLLIMCFLLSMGNRPQG